VSTPAPRRENALLFAASRCPAAPPRSLATDGEYDWQYVLKAAEQQGVSALLRQWLAAGMTIAAPEWARSALDAAYWGQHFRNRFLLEAFAAFLARVADAGISVMPLKGAALVRGYYPAAALRPMSDLDLLVRPDDAERMAHLLHGCGYLPVTRPAAGGGDREYAFVSHRPEGAVLVEYRSEPLDPITGFPASLDPVLAVRLRAHAARMWERGTPGEFGGAPVVRIASEDLLLHITSHLATRHAGFRLLWLHDVCRVLVAHPTDFNWRYFWDEAALLNLTVPVEAALAAAHRWLDAPLVAPTPAPPPASGGGAPRCNASSNARKNGTAYRSGLPPPLGGRRGGGGGSPAPMPALERRIAMSAVARLDRTDMAIGTPRAWAEAVTAFCRLTSARPRLRALLFFVAPSREYLAWWMIEQGKPAARYHRMLAARWRRVAADAFCNVRAHVAAIARRAVPARRR
jgi:hypothetical protein